MSRYDYTSFAFFFSLLSCVYRRDMPCSYRIYFYFSLYTPNKKKLLPSISMKKTRAVEEIRTARKRIIFLYFFISQSNVPSSFLKAVSQFQHSPSFFTLPWFSSFFPFRFEYYMGKDRKRKRKEKEIRCMEIRSLGKVFLLPFLCSDVAFCCC